MPLEVWTQKGKRSHPNTTLLIIMGKSDILNKLGPPFCAPAAGLAPCGWPLTLGAEPRFPVLITAPPAHERADGTPAFWMPNVPTLKNLDTNPSWRMWS